MVISVNLAKFEARYFGKNHHSGTNYKLVMVNLYTKNHVNICKHLEKSLDTDYSCEFQARNFGKNRRSGTNYKLSCNLFHGELIYKKSCQYRQAFQKKNLEN